MKVYVQRLIVLGLFLVSSYTFVMAQDSADPDYLNKLLLDGVQEVTISKLSMTDVFDKSSTWESYNDDTSTLEVKKGVYHMFHKGNSFAWGLNGENESDTVIQVKTLQNSEEKSNYYGVICRADPSNNGYGYYFEITGDGFYGIARVDGSDFHMLVDWTESKAINQGQDANEMIAVCAGNYLALYVNEVLLAETNDDTFSEGQTGLTAGAFADTSEVDISFDDVNIWQAEVSGGATSVAPAGQPEVLKDFGGDSEAAVAELEQLGVIPSGSTLIFGEDYAYFTGRGSWFTPLASRSPRKNIVAGGELTFTIGNKNAFELCTLTTRINTDDQGTATTYIDVGLGNDGFVYIFDRFSESQDSSLEIGPNLLNLNQPHHLLFLLIDDKATIYVDGKLEISDFTIVERSGSYGIGLLGEGPQARCEGRNIWAYAVPSARPGECVVSAGGAVNKRNGPGTNFGTAGQLPAGEEATVIGQNQASDGKTWWQLDDESWVREDVVTAIGDCAGVPSVS